jgi:hypothetical protein
MGRMLDRQMAETAEVGTLRPSAVCTSLDIITNTCQEIGLDNAADGGCI